MTKIELLKNTALFGKLDKSHLNQVSKIADEIVVPAGKVLVKQGERGCEFFYILEGKANVEMGGKVADTFTANNYFGEISILDGKPSMATVATETSTRLLVMDSNHFMPFLEQTPAMSNEIMVNLCQYLRRTTRSW